MSRNGTYSCRWYKGIVCIQYIVKTTWLGIFRAVWTKFDVRRLTFFLIAIAPRVSSTREDEFGVLPVRTDWWINYWTISGGSKVTPGTKTYSRVPWL